MSTITTYQIINQALEKDKLDDTWDKEFFGLEDRTTDILSALASVLNYTITDAFALSIEESMFVGYNLNQALSPLSQLMPTAVLGAVSKELRNKTYSGRLFERPETKGAPATHSGVKYAPLEDWVESLSEVILLTYPSLRPMIKSSIIGALHGLLTELGVSSKPGEGRGSLYLPNAVRSKIG